MHCTGLVVAPQQYTYCRAGYLCPAPCRILRSDVYSGCLHAPVVLVVLLVFAVVRAAPVALGLSFPFFLFVVGFALVAVQ